MVGKKIKKSEKKSKKYKIINKENNKNLVENKLLRANQMGKSKSQKIKLPPMARVPLKSRPKWLACPDFSPPIEQK